MENSQIKEQVEYVCNEFETQNNIQVSTHTRTLIIKTLIAIKEDPHPRWEKPSSKSAWQDESEVWDDVINTYLSTLPLFLKQIEVTERAEGRITYFHALHWISESLIAMCIIKK